jgi:ABC-type glycerol-3-phosphate transport system permease component
MSDMLGTFFKYLFGVLGISGLVLVWTQTSVRTKEVNFATQVTQLVGSVRQYYGGQTNFTSLTNTLLVTAQAVPAGLLNGTAIQNPWGGAVTFAVNANATMFNVTTTTVPLASCARVANAINSYASLTINAVVFTPTTAAVDAGAVAAACSVTTAAGNTLLFVFTG